MPPWKIKTQRGKLDITLARGVWSRFGRYLRPHRWKLAGAFAGAMGCIAMQIITPWPIKVIFDYILTDSMSNSWLADMLGRVSSSKGTALIWVCGAIVLIALGDSLFAYMRDVNLAHTGQRVVGKIRQDLFAHLQTLSPDVYERRRTGDLLTRLTGDIQMLRQMLVNALITSGQAGLMIVAMIAVMFWLNPTLAALGVVTVPIIIWSSWRISRKIRKATITQREAEGVVASIAHDVLGAMSVVQAFNRQAYEHKRFSRQNRSSVRAGLRTTRLQSKLQRIIAVASAVGMCLILYVGVRSVLKGMMTAGDLLVFVSYLRALNKPMRRVAKLSGQVAKATSCGTRVAELFAIKPTIHNRPNAVPLTSPRGELELQDLTFAYDERANALSQVSLHIAPGERIALVGHTGAGKSTIVKLLLRFYDPDVGAVRIDGIDIRDIAIESLRSHIGWVHQDTVLFGMTVAENIALGTPDADRDQIEEAARRVQADEFILALPDGYDTQLGQGGSALSGGQRQRLALARAMLHRPSVLLLDEPATGLDAETRELVERAWHTPKREATTIVICHRLNHMERFDRIVVLRDGAIVECGSHRDLLARHGEYATMYAGDYSHLKVTDDVTNLAC